MRNNLTMAVTLYAFCLQLIPYMIFNWDATQYSIIKESDKEVVIVKIERDKEPATAESSGTVAISINHFHLHNGAGEVAAPVFLVSDDSLCPEEFPETV